VHEINPVFVLPAKDWRPTAGELEEEDPKAVDVSVSVVNLLVHMTSSKGV
jgi:hypothetical protein